MKKRWSNVEFLQVNKKIQHHCHSTSMCFSLLVTVTTPTYDGCHWWQTSDAANMNDFLIESYIMTPEICTAVCKTLGYDPYHT